MLVIAVVGILIYWQWQNITGWFSGTTVGITQLFGWGLILVVLAILTFIVVILSKPVLLLRYWNRWIGLLILLVAVWGILAFIPSSGYLADFSLGGQIGQSIIGSSLAISILIVFFLLVLGFLFVTPRGFARMITGFFSWLFGRMSKEPATGSVAPLPQAQITPRISVSGGEQENDLRPTAFPRFKPEPKPRPAQPIPGSKNWLWNRLHQEATQPAVSSPPVEEIAAKDVIQPPEANSETPEASDAAKLDAKEKEKAGHSKDLKQVAQEVWKKYGEAATETTVDGWKLPPLEILDYTSRKWNSARPIM